MKQVILLTPYRGYTLGELTGNRDGFRYEVKLHGSGKILYLYEDEFKYCD